MKLHNVSVEVMAFNADGVDDGVGNSMGKLEIVHIELPIFFVQHKELENLQTLGHSCKGGIVVN